MPGEAFGVRRYPVPGSPPCRRSAPREAGFGGYPGLRWFGLI